jgi:uroporphyrinogen decarboxylase
MDGKTRVIHAIEGKKLDRIPRFDSLWEDTVTLWEKDGYPKGADPVDYFDFDIIRMFMDVSQQFETKILKVEGEIITLQDHYGYTAKRIKGKAIGTQFIDHVTKDRAIWDESKKRLKFDPAGLSRIDSVSHCRTVGYYPTWDEAKEKYDKARKRDKFIIYDGYGPWESNWRHRGYTELLLDMLTTPEWAEEMGRCNIELIVRILSHCIERDMKPDGFFIEDDFCDNRGVICGIDTWREIYKPFYNRLGRFLRENGIYFFMHCCGNVVPLLEDLIECGVQVIQPLQASAGIDVRTLKKLFGEKLTFWGNIDVTKMSDPDESVIRKEMREKIGVAKKNGGYIYFSDHSVPPEVSFKRYRLVMELLNEYGEYTTA